MSAMSMTAISGSAVTASAGTGQTGAFDAVLADPNIYNPEEARRKQQDFYGIGPEETTARRTQQDFYSIGPEQTNTSMKLIPYAERVPVIDSPCGVYMYYIPTTEEYFQSLGGYGYMVLGAGTIVLIVILAIYMQEIIHVVRKSQRSHKTAVLSILTTFPMIAVSTMTSLIFPRTILVYEAVTTIYFAFALYMFFLLTLHYYGGETGMVQYVFTDVLPLAGPPCCCWPCCICCPSYKVNKPQLKFTRILVLQFPIVVSVTYLIILSLWSSGIYTPGKVFDVSDAYPWLSLIVLASTLTGLYGFIIMRNLAHENLSDFHYMPKFFALLLIIIFTRLQGLVFTILGIAGYMPCFPLISPMVMGQTIQQTVSLLELAILSYINRNLYLREIPAQLGPPRAGLMGPQNLIMDDSNPLSYKECTDPEKQNLTNSISNGVPPQLIITTPTNMQLQVPTRKT